MYNWNTRYSANMGMYNGSYGQRMNGNILGLAGISNQIIRGSFICNTVNVIDTSGQIRRRLDCRPVNTTSSGFSIMY